MIIRKYRLFEEKIELQTEFQDLFIMAINTDDIDLVKFFIDKNAKIDDGAVETALDYDDVLEYFFTMKMTPKQLNGNYKVLRSARVQKYMIDNGYIQSIYDEVKFNDILNDDDKYKRIIHDFYMTYYKENDVTDDALNWAIDDNVLLRFLLSKNPDINFYYDKTLKRVGMQKALIDYGYIQTMYDKAKFNPDLSNNKKYKKIILDFYKSRDITEDSLTWSVDSDIDLFKYYLDNKIDLHKFGNWQLKGLEVQKILIDYGHGHYIFDNVNFNSKLRNDPKYADTVNMLEDSGKYNL